ncbi:MAG: DNA-directed RNA polymerase subunit alpha C-terminal domain-containing protein [Phycisphaerae bacterium]
MTETTLDPAAFFSAGSLDVDAIHDHADAAYASFRTYERFRELAREYEGRVGKGSGEPLRLAAALYILAQYSEALEWFAKSPDNKLRRYFAAQSLLALHRFEDALKELERAAARGWDEFEIDMQTAAAQLRAGELGAAASLLKKNAKRGEDRGEWYYVKGLLAEEEAEREAAVDFYEKALELSPDHPGAMFRCARLYDLLGDEGAAIELYHLLSLQPRAYVNALMNLAVIYEDIGNYEDAVECLQRVLKAYPNHARARLFLKDVESSRQMVIDEAVEQKIDARRRLLDTPITDFELSVRARNCLKKMRINTLGELLRLSEQELLAFKNFGETSLTEIKAVLLAKGLQLGMRPEDVDVNAVIEATTAAKPVVAVPPGSEAILSKPVSEMELSVRARRCLQRLNVATLGELIQHTETDLMSTRNFGVTSLSEIKARLTEFGLSLAPKR